MNETIDDFLAEAEPYIQRKSRTTNFKTPLFHDFNDVAQNLRIAVWKSFPSWLKVKDRWQNGRMVWIKLMIRRKLWDIGQKEKKELLFHGDGLSRYRIASEEGIQRTEGLEDESVFETKVASDKGNDKRMLLLKLDINRAFDNINLTEKEEKVFWLTVAGYTAKEIEEKIKESLSQTGKRNIVWAVREKIKRYWSFKPRRIKANGTGNYYKKIAERNNKIEEYKKQNSDKSLSEIGIIFGLSKQSIRLILLKAQK